MSIQTIQLDRLRPHPENSNVMPDVLVEKLANHIQRTGRYPPLIVRPLHDPDNQSTDISATNARYQILDGHHRARALQEACRDTAQCIVWQADDQEALLLLATLNRLQGQDDPRKRAKLISRLAEQHNLPQLSTLLPERSEQIKKYLEFKNHPPPLRKPNPIEQMPIAVHFFLTSPQKSQLDAVLRQLEGSREEALMKLIARQQAENHIQDPAP